MLNDIDSAVAKAGAESSVVEYFGIDGLFGYRSVSLNSKFAATIVIAQNGAGKTTLLGALDAFLKCQFRRLRELHFSKIECRLRGISESLVLHKTDLDFVMQALENKDIYQFAKTNEIDPASLVDFLIWEYPLIKKVSRELTQHPIFRKIYLRDNYDIQATRLVFDWLESLAGTSGSVIPKIRKLIQSVLWEYEVVYLPTYRRIEISLPDIEERRGNRRSESIQSKLGISSNSLYSGDIRFGLSDISQRLVTLNNSIQAQSNEGYREVSANIINDLINGDFEREDPSLEDRPTKEALALFFARLKDGRETMGPYSTYAYEPMLQVPDLDKIYDEESIPENSRKFLNYFLGKLNTVLKKTRDVESVVEEFVNSCNKYLSSQDETVIPPGERRRRKASEDNKILTLDRRNLGVTVLSESTKRKILLDALSSGEKQMISLFARLYLYPKKKIVLVDEPELSLSIDWQRKILVDIVSAPLCEQVIAITHSPFIFDNDLEPFATSLRSRVDQNALTTGASPEDEEEEHE